MKYRARFSPIASAGTFASPCSPVDPPMSEVFCPCRNTETLALPSGSTASARIPFRAKFEPKLYCPILPVASCPGESRTAGMVPRRIPERKRSPHPEVRQTFVSDLFDAESIACDLTKVFTATGPRLSNTPPISPRTTGWPRPSFSPVRGGGLQRSANDSRERSFAT